MYFTVCTVCTVPQNEYHAPDISIGETVLKSVEQFTYLGCAISSNARIDGEIDNRLAKVNSAFGRLYKRVWNNKHLRIIMKISVYRAVVLTTLLYFSKSWVTYWNHLKLLERFHQRCLRTILNIHWSNYITNIIVLERADITSIKAMFLKIQLRWAGHVSRMEDHRLPKIILQGELSSGLRNRGAPKKRYKDTLKKVPWCVQHQPSWVDYPCRRPRHMASHYKQSCLLLRILPEACHRGKTSEEEKQCSHNTKPRRDLYLLSLQLDLSIPHRPDKSRACLQEAWTSWTWSSLAKQSHDSTVCTTTTMTQKLRKLHFGKW